MKELDRLVRMRGIPQAHALEAAWPALAALICLAYDVFPLLGLQCPAAHRLPALFLLDCILKTDGPAVYLQHINGVLKEVCKLGSPLVLHFAPLRPETCIY